MSRFPLKKNAVIGIFFNKVFFDCARFLAPARSRKKIDCPIFGVGLVLKSYLRKVISD